MVRRTCSAGRADQLLVTSEMLFRRDVAALCPTPRLRDVPGSLQAARVADSLAAALAAAPSDLGLAERH